MRKMKKEIVILGIRGIPANHGGFETFAERLALFLVNNGWCVTVYCQADPSVKQQVEDVWCGIKRVTLPVLRDGALATVEFDWKCVTQVAKTKPQVVLTLGYNTAVFSAWLRMKGIRNIINMDGLEWKRNKWRPHERAWLWANERIGCLVGNCLIADHPEIAKHLATRVSPEKIVTIPYGADRVESADIIELEKYGLEPDRYAIIVARPEPENSILQIVEAFSARKRDVKLVVLGGYETTNRYQREVLDAASDEVIFPGAIYNRPTLEALRFYARFYVHGHQVGGTNPSLVEALGVGSAVLAHDNVFNRWVAGDSAVFFDSVDDCDSQITSLFGDFEEIQRMRKEAVLRFDSGFRWDGLLNRYEQVLSETLSVSINVSTESADSSPIRNS
jgi:glycosyltransferase involved in cell wall biosynthesis